MALQILTDLGNGRVREAVHGFAERFTYEDRGVGFECTEKDRLAEFFKKARELYPDSVLEAGPIVASGDDVALEWTMRTSVSEPLLGAFARRVRVVIHGASIVRTENGRVTRWSDYYDGLGARRTALSSYFTEWIEL
jgi:hypothetical protein